MATRHFCDICDAELEKFEHDGQYHYKAIGTYQDSIYRATINVHVTGEQKHSDKEFAVCRKCLIKILSQGENGK